MASHIDSNRAGKNRINRSHPFSKTDRSPANLKSIVLQNNENNYMIEKYIYTNSPNLYFSFSKNADPKDAKNILWNSLLLQIMNRALSFYNN